jgi:NitT/TauT family transport system permease protein
MQTGRMRYYSHQGRRTHPTTIVKRIGSGLVLPLAIVFIASFIATGIVFVPTDYALEGGELFIALGASALRLLSAFLLALVFGIPLGLLAESNPRVEGMLLPVYDVLESMPILAFFPVIILFFIRSDFLEGAAVFILFYSMLWTIAFSVIGGMKTIPQDVQAAGKVFGLSRWQRLKQITLPALFPPLLTASILAVADGWNIVIVAETLHAYAPHDVNAHDLFGIGSILVSASASGNGQLLLVAMAFLVAFIACVNVFVWQPLLSKAQRFKFE